MPPSICFSMRAPEFWTRGSGGARALGALLSPLAALYGLAARAQPRGEPYRAKARVLCVGNLTVGGSGKTPTAIALARMLIARGVTVVFVTRGYGGSLAGPLEVDASRHSAAEVGDEPLLLARQATTVVARDRAAGAALADRLGADVVILDDGHQNFSLAKDLSFVVIDGETGLGNGRLLPAGPLREPAAVGLARADALTVMGSGTPALSAFHGPVLHASLAPDAGEALKGKAVFAFAGIGRPEKFFRTLRDMGAQVDGSLGFADHHAYGAAELASLRTAADRLGLMLVTTEKDYARLPPGERYGILPVPVHAVFAEPDAVERLLDRLAPTGEGPRR
jgi:tetraacyldisaccharide 4'-kinase